LCRWGRKKGGRHAQQHHHIPALDRGPRELPAVVSWSSPSSSFVDISVCVWCVVGQREGEARVGREFWGRKTKGMVGPKKRKREAAMKSRTTGRLQKEGAARKFMGTPGCAEKVADAGAGVGKEGGGAGGMMKMWARGW